MTERRPPAGRVHRVYRVEGRVQMVGFRAFVRRHAVELGLAGWVRNEPDGSVAAEAAGAPGTLERFEELLRQGPPAARVERLRVRELTSHLDLESFEVRF